jgi:hypothetical protein
MSAGRGDGHSIRSPNKNNQPCSSEAQQNPQKVAMIESFSEEATFSDTEDCPELCANISCPPGVHPDSKTIEYHVMGAIPEIAKMAEEVI